MVAATRPATIADLDNMPDDGRRYELIDGEIIGTAAPTWPHQRAARAIFLLLDTWVEQRRLGAVQFAPFDIVLADQTVVEPDVFVLLSASLRNIRDGRYFGVPDLAVEVISPTNRDIDTVIKMFWYARSGIREYWLADSATRTIQILSLVDGIYVPQKANDHGHYASVALPGLMIDPNIIFIPVDPAT